MAVTKEALDTLAGTREPRARWLQASINFCVQRPLGAIGVSVVTAAFVLVIGQAIFSFVRTPILRIAVALIFAIPAALGGYYATFGLSDLTMTSDLWRQAFAVIGAVSIGATAWTRLAAAPPAMPAGTGRPALSRSRVAT